MEAESGRGMASADEGSSGMGAAGEETGEEGEGGILAWRGGLRWIDEWMDGQRRRDISKKENRLQGVHSLIYDILTFIDNRSKSRNGREF